MRIPRRAVIATAFLTLLSAAVIFSSAPARLQAQDPKPPGGIDEPSRPLRATQSWQTFQSDDGYTVWRKELEGTCSYEDHNYTLDVTADPNEMTDISYSMSNFDVDYNDPQDCEGGPEVDIMSLNGGQLGILTGANGSWSINEWPLNASQIVSGSNSIFIDTDSTGTDCWCVGVGYIQIKARVGFKVTSYTPSDDDKNRDFHAGALDLTVTLSKAYKQASLNTNTFKLEYRNQGGAWQSVNGTFTPLADNKFRFVPSADLLDGVKYRVTIKSGDAGLRGSSDEKLDADTVWYFWTVPDLDKSDAFDYGSGSTCPPTTSPCTGVEIAVFQVSRNANMVPQKDAVARLYLRWQRHTDVHADDQVKELEVDAKMSVDGSTDTLRQTVKRPDQYSAGERQNAANTINFFRKPNNAFNYDVEVQPVPQSNATPVKFNKSNNLTSSGRSPNIQFDYYFLKDGDWKAAVPPAAKTDGRNIFNAGVQLINDQWPVLTTAYTERGEFSIGYTRTVTGPVGSGTAWFVNCPGSPAQIEEWRCIYQRLSTMLGGHPVVAATVPNGLYPGATAFALGKVFMHQSGSGANDGTVAHEMGHVFGISTANNPTDGHRNDSTKVEGYQVRTRVNHSYVENQSKSVSLMHTTLQPQGTQWVDNRDYTTLLGTVTAASAAFDAAAQPADVTSIAANDYLIVSGYVNTTTNAATTFAVFRQSLPNDVPSNTGACLAQLLGPSNNVLSASNFKPGLLLLPQTGGIGPGGIGPASTNADSWQEFSVSLPWNDAATAIKISCNGTALLTVTKSANAPSVSIASPAQGATLSGEQTVSWSGSDADGDPVNYQLQVSVDNGASWSPLSPLDAATSFALDTTRLPSLNGVQLRVMATDGFNTTTAVRSVNISNPLAVAGSYPNADDVNILPDGDIRVRFVSPLDVSSLTTETFQLLRYNYEEISGTLSYDADVQEVHFRPTLPMKYDSQYSVFLMGTLKDSGGHALITDTTWTFRVISDTIAPVIQRVSPQSGEVNVPRNPLIYIRFSEPMDTGSVNTSTVQLLGPGNVAVPGEVRYDYNFYAAIFSPTVTLSPNTVYQVRATTGLQDENANSLELNREWSFTTGDAVNPYPMRIIGNYTDQPGDANKNGRYETLTIFVDVEVREPNTYNINARLVDRNGKLIQWTLNEDYFYEGVYRIPLVYNGYTIGASGAAGPYSLQSVNFYDVRDPLIAETQQVAYKTFAYTPAQFDTLNVLLPVILRN